MRATGGPLLSAYVCTVAPLNLSGFGTSCSTPALQDVDDPGSDGGLGQPLVGLVCIVVHIEKWHDRLSFMSHSAIKILSRNNVHLKIRICVLSFVALAWCVPRLARAYDIALKPGGAADWVFVERGPGCQAR